MWGGLGSGWWGAPPLMVGAVIPPDPPDPDPEPEPDEEFDDMAITVQSICEAAAQELNIIMTGENLSANDGAVVLRSLNAILDSWTVRKHKLFTVSFPTYTLVPGLQPHTIGPTGTFVLWERPVSIGAANLIYQSSPTVKTPIAIATVAKEWMGLSMPSTSASMPSGIYYRPDWPNGSLFIYPVPSTAYTIELLIRAPFSQVAMTDSIGLPPGYRRALTLTLAEEIAVAFDREIPASLERRARAARSDVFDANDTSVNLITVDDGMPGNRIRRGSYHTRWT